MDKDEILSDIFNNDPLGLLNVKPKQNNTKTSEDRLSDSFQEINDFVSQNNREPEPSISNIFEYKLYTRLKGIREDNVKVEQLKSIDTHNLLPVENENNKPIEINTINDIFSSDSLDILGDDSGLFDFKHTPKIDEREKTDFIARRKPCKDFDNYKQLLKNVQIDLKEGRRKIVDFKLNTLREKSFYIHNGVLFYIEEINMTKDDHYKDDGTRVRRDGRTRCIFENGTESNMLMRSVEKILYDNGRAVTDNNEQSNKSIMEDFIINEDDKEAGYIYVLKSKSTNPEIQSIKNLYKIGYSTTKVEDRIRNASKEPTYLMADVDYITGWQCYNLNPQKFEHLIHSFFGSSCLNLEVVDSKGKKHKPREWFIAPLVVIEEVVESIINGDIINMYYDPLKEKIIFNNS